MLCSCASSIRDCNQFKKLSRYIFWTGTPMDALIIDDSRAMRGIIKRIITPLGFDAIEAENGQDGLEKLKQFSDTLELILVDWNMPVMDGLQFIKILREDESLRRICVIMITTETEPAQMARALLAGADEFVMKPFTAEILIQRLQLLGVRCREQAWGSP